MNMDFSPIFKLHNDFTARSIQEKELRKHYGYVKSKVINSMGPYLVIGLNPYEVNIHVKVNGREVLSCTGKNINYKIEEVISYVSSQGEGIKAGQVIGLGALSGGTLFEMELDLLKSGDIVELIGNQQIGRLVNTIK